MSLARWFRVGSRECAHPFLKGGGEEERRIFSQLNYLPRLSVCPGGFFDAMVNYSTWCTIQMVCECQQQEKQTLVSSLFQFSSQRR